MSTISNQWDGLARLLSMESSTKKVWFRRTLLVLIACACLGGALFVGRCVKNADADYPWPYVVFIDRPVVLSNWDSVEELQTFLDETHIRLVIVSGEDFNGQCENLAFQLRDEAAEHGKRLETEILTRAECIKYQRYLTGNAYSLGWNDGHVICKAVVGNAWYFIEPANDAIWKAYYLD